MSVVYLEAFEINIQTEQIKIRHSPLLLILFSLISVIFFILYTVCYLKIVYFNRNPNPVIYLKVLSEFVLSMHFIFIYLNMYIPNKYSNTIIHVSSIISVPTLFCCYFFNCCLAHNIYETFYSYNKSFIKRKIKYISYSIISTIILTLISIISFNNNYISEIIKTNKDTNNIYEINFSTHLFNREFLCLYYILCFIMIIYMCNKLRKVYINKINLLTVNMSIDQNKTKLIKAFVRRHTLYIVFFVVAFLPNNLISLYVLFFNKHEMFINKKYTIRFFNSILMSLILITSLIITAFDPCIKKFIKYMILHVFCNKDITRLLNKINKGKEYINIYNDEKDSNIKLKNSLLSDSPTKNLSKIKINNDFNLNNKKYIEMNYISNIDKSISKSDNYFINNFNNTNNKADNYIIENENKNKNIYKDDNINYNSNDYNKYHDVLNIKNKTSETNNTNNLYKVKYRNTLNYKDNNIFTSIIKQSRKLNNCINLIKNNNFKKAKQSKNKITVSNNDIPDYNKYSIKKHNVFPDELKLIKSKSFDSFSFNFINNIELKHFNHNFYNNFNSLYQNIDNNYYNDELKLIEKKESLKSLLSFKYINKDISEYSLNSKNSLIDTKLGNGVVGRSSLSVLDEDDYQYMKLQTINFENFEKIISLYVSTKETLNNNSNCNINKKKSQKFTNNVEINKKHKDKKYNSINQQNDNNILFKNTNLNYSKKSLNKIKLTRSDSCSKITVKSDTKDKLFFSGKPLIVNINKEMFPKEIKSNCNMLINNLTVRIYFSQVFEEIRELYNISSQDLLISLNPLMNISECINNTSSFNINNYNKNKNSLYNKFKKEFSNDKSKKYSSNYNNSPFDNLTKSGGNSGIPITTTWDNKLMLKNITTNEKNMLFKLIKDYYYKLTKKGCLLCPIFGLFRIDSEKMPPMYLILMKNMNDINETLTKLYTFDLKGSTVNRMTMSYDELNIIKKNSLLYNHNKSVYNLNNKVMKDEDFRLLGINYLNFVDSERYRFINLIEEDALLLKKYNITDYSILLSIYDLKDYYNTLDLENNLTERSEKFDYISKLQNYNNTFISEDQRYLYQIAIIDFLTEYDLKKMGENFAKSLKMFLLREKDTNISAQNAFNYFKRFVSYGKSLVGLYD